MTLAKDRQKTVERFDPTTGTPLWGMNRLREDAFPRLLDDLLLLERKGIAEVECDQVKIALGKIIHVATGIPDGGFLKRAIWKELEKFTDIYHEWNSMNERTDPDAVDFRRIRLRKLRDRRHKIAKSIRKHQHILSNELDLQLVDSCYEAMGDLARALPSLFANLAKAVARFNSGKVA